MARSLSNVPAIEDAPRRELLKAITHAPARPRRILRFVYACGASTSELRGLRWRDVVARDGRGRVTIENRKGARLVWISAGTYGDVVRWRSGAADTAPVFPGRAGEPMSCRQLERVVKAAAIAAGLPPSTSVRSLRRAHERHAQDRGADATLVAKTLGIGVQMVATRRDRVAAPRGRSSGLHLGV